MKKFILLARATRAEIFAMKTRGILGDVSKKSYRELFNILIS